MQTVERTITLPLGGEATVRGMRGLDEDLLANRKKMETGEALSQIIANCTLTLRDKSPLTVSDVDQLKEPDRRALVLAIRQESYGDTVTADLKCGECQKEFQVDVDIANVTQVAAPEGYIPETGYVVALSDGQKVTIDYPTGKKERVMLRAGSEELVTQLLLSRLRAVEDVNDLDLKRWLKNLPVKLRRELRAEMEKVECGPDIQRTADCIHCGNEVAFQLHAVSGFFFPG